MNVHFFLFVPRIWQKLCIIETENLSMTIPFIRKEDFSPQNCIPDKFSI